MQQLAQQGGVWGGRSGLENVARPPPSPADLCFLMFVIAIYDVGCSGSGYLSRHPKVKLSFSRCQRRVMPIICRIVECLAKYAFCVNARAGLHAKSACFLQGLNAELWVSPCVFFSES